MTTGFAMACWLAQAAPPPMRFVSLGSRFRLRLPSHPASRRRSCPRLVVAVICSTGDSHPRAAAHAGRTRARPPGGGLKRRSKGSSGGPICPSERCSRRAGIPAGGLNRCEASNAGWLVRFIRSLPSGRIVKTSSLSGLSPSAVRQALRALATCGCAPAGRRRPSAGGGRAAGGTRPSELSWWVGRDRAVQRRAEDYLDVARASCRRHRRSGVW
jgi:hypothetical protein